MLPSAEVVACRDRGGSDGVGVGVIGGDSEVENGRPVDEGVTGVGSETVPTSEAADDA